MGLVETPREAALEQYRLTVVPPDGTTLLQASNIVSSAISPDGRNLAFVAGTDGARHIWVRPLNATTARHFPGTELAEGVFWAPDSRRVGFATGTRIMTIDLATGALKEVCTIAFTLRGASWNAAGVIVFGSTGSSGIYAVPADGGVPVAVTTVNREREATHQFPHFLPDGRRFLFWVRGIDPQWTGIYAGSLDAPSVQLVRQRILASTDQVNYVDGQLLFPRGKTLFAQAFGAERLTLSGDPVPVMQLESTRDHVTVSRNGLLATSRNPTSRAVTIVGRDGRAIASPGEPGPYLAARLSPNGRTAALVRTNNELATVDLWLMDLANGVPTRFTHQQNLNLNPVWSPDGKEILFASNREGIYKVFRKPISGDLAEKKVLESEDQQLPADWSRDGKLILIVRRRANENAEMSVHPISALHAPAAAFRGSDARFSPDSRWVALVSMETGTPEVYVQAASGAAGESAPKVRVSRSGGLNPAWRSDGGELYFSTQDNRLMAAPVRISAGRFEAGEPKVLFALGGISHYNGAVFWEPFATGQQFMVLRDVPLTARENRISLVLNWKESLLRRP